VPSKRATFISPPKGQAHNQTRILLVIGAGLMLIAIAAFLSLPKAQTEVISAGTSAIPLTVNFPAPEVKLTDLQGRPVALSDYKGQVVLYNAWATWCPPCKQEMPALEAYYEAHKTAGLMIVAIEDGEPVSDVADFVESYGLTFPVWPDLKWVATTAFKSDSLPTSFVIDRAGIVRLTWTGAISREMLEKYVTPMLGQ
jgi:cytochrome c biogenesis protein CcmG, thiol:disulfide interchange protein DsbE